MNKKKLNRRKIYFINKKFQLTFILYTLIPSILSLLVMYAVIDFYFAELISNGKEVGLTSNHPYFRLISDQMSLMNKGFIGLVFFNIIFFFLWGAIVSHKIAGPLYRLCMHFEQIAKTKKWEKLSFRPNDFFQEIPAVVNKVKDSMEKAKEE